MLSIERLMAMIHMMASRCARSTSSPYLGVPVNKVTIIGTGIMGSGIAQVVSASHMDVTLVGRSHTSLTNALSSISKFSRVMARKKFGTDKEAQQAMIDDIEKRISTTTNIRKAVINADVVIEAVVENLRVKQQIFEQIETAPSKSEALLATNTSSLRVADVGAKLKRRRSNFGGLHFFNPVPIMQLLEVIRCDETSSITMQRLLEFGKVLGKVTVECTDKPGFVVNRLLISYVCEALRMVEHDGASIKDIDIAMRFGAGHVKGPFELINFIGTQTFRTILKNLHEAYPEDSRFDCSAFLDRLIAEGKLGKKV